MVACFLPFGEHVPVLITYMEYFVAKDLYFVINAKRFTLQDGLTTISIGYLLNLAVH